MKKIFFMVYLATLSIVVFAQKAQSDKELITATLNNYIEGRNNGDTTRLSSAFHQKADLRSRDLKTGKMMIWPSTDYVSNFTPGKKINCTGKIIYIDIAGSAAQAKVELYYPDGTYADYMNLLKILDTWIIASKVYSLYPSK